MTIHDSINNWIKTEINPKYQEQTRVEIIDHMTGNKKGNPFIEKTCKIIMDKHESS